MIDLILPVIILILAVHVLKKEFGTMPDGFSALLVKVLGAGTGSGVAVLFRPGRDGILRLLLRWLVGLWVGYSGTGAAIEYFSLSTSDDMVLFVASALGITGYMLVQIVLSPEVANYLKSKLGAHAESKPE
jgi:hypothetical protein